MVTDDKLKAAFSLYQQNKYAEAKPLFDALTQDAPDNPNVWHLAGANESALGNPAQGLKWIAHANSLRENAMYHNTAGTIYLRVQQLEAAIAAFSRAVALKPDYVDAHFSLGLCQLLSKAFQEASRCFLQVLSLAPTHADAAFRLGNCLQEMGRFAEALSIYERAFADHPQRVDILFSIGTCLEQLGEFEAALDRYQAVLAAQPTVYLAVVRKAEVLERLGRLDECEAWTRSALAKAPQSPELTVTLAKVWKRRGHVDGALALLKALPLPRTPAHLFEQGLLLDKLARFDEAFACIDEANKALTTSQSAIGTMQDSYRKELDDMALLQCRPMPIGNDDVEVPLQDKLVFLVGFPRSGTTLIDCILSVHPKIATYEETAALERTYVKAKQMFGGSVEGIALAKQSQLNELRDFYREQLVGEQPPADAEVLIDRHPFHTWQIPFIRVLFPKARILMTHRHPLDSILSCYLRDFQLHVGTSFFFSLPAIDELYCRMLDIVASDDQFAKTAGRQAIHHYCYEDLVRQTKTTLDGVLDFLGMTWLEEMADHSSHSKRKIINTLSYDQALLPVYTTATDRWRNYQSHFTGISDELTAVIARLGYGEP